MRIKLCTVPKGTVSGGPTGARLHMQRIWFDPNTAGLQNSRSYSIFAIICLGRCIFVGYSNLIETWHSAVFCSTLTYQAISPSFVTDSFPAPILVLQASVTSFAVQCSTEETTVRTAQHNARQPAVTTRPTRDLKKVQLHMSVNSEQSLSTSSSQRSSQLPLTEPCSLPCARSRHRPLYPAPRPSSVSEH